MPLKLRSHLFLSQSNFYARAPKKTTSRFKSKVLLVLLFASLITTLPMLHFTEVGAVNTYNAATSSIDWQIKSKIYYEAIKNCMSSTGLSSASYLSKNDIDNGKWFGYFGDPTTSVGVYVRDDIINNASGMNDKDWYASWIRDKEDWDGMTQCKNPALIKSALNTWGIPAIEILCNSGLIRKTIYREQSVAECISNSGYDLEGFSNKVKMDPVAFSNYIKRVVYGITDGTEPQVPGTGDTTTSAGAPWYKFYKHTLDQSCITGIDTNDGSGSILKSDEKLNYRDVKLIQSTTNAVVSVMFGGTLNNDNNTNIGPISGSESYQPNGPKGTMLECKDIVSEMNKYAASYVLKLVKVADGSESATTIAITAPPDGGTKNNTTECAIPSVGWILCPIIDTMGSIIDASWGLISNMLKTDVSIVNSGTSANPNPAFSAWKIMQGIANVAFVIAFLIIIFSQVTSIGVTNYGIKKLLPRLIIAAILVNVSFYICQIAVDLSNILGSSLKGVFDGLATTVYKPEFTGNTANPGGIIAGVIGGVAGVAVLWASVGTLIPVLLAGIVAIVMILFILIARQALIILLIVISPLAFVAYLLPNTEKLFQKWQKAFTSMLLVYPIIAIVIGGSSFAATILKDVLVDPVNPNSNIIAKIGAAAVAILPLFIVPGLLKKSLDGVGSIGGKISGFGDKLGKGAGGLGKKAYDNSALARGRAIREQAKTNYRNQKFAKSLGKNGPRSFFASNRIPLTPTARYANRQLQRTATAESEKADNAAVASEQSVLESKILAGTIPDADTAYRSAIDKNDSIGAKAALNVKFQTARGRTEAHTLLKYAETQTTAGKFKAENIQSLKKHISVAHPDMDGKDSSIADWGHNKILPGGAAPATLTNLETVPDTFRLSDTKLAGQAKNGLVQAYATGALDDTVAARILANDNLKKDLKMPEREYLDRIIASGRGPLNLPPVGVTDTGF